MADMNIKVFVTIVWISLLVFPGFTMAQWELQYPKPTDRELEDVSFVDDLNGWIVGEKGVILHTSDGGESWEFQESGTELRLRSVFFSDIQNGWIVGGETHPIPGECIIINTVDGGENWDIQYVNSLLCLNSVFFTDSEKGWAVGENGAIYHTNNGGVEWVRQYTGAPSDACEEVFFTDSLNGWIAAGSGLYRTTNGGSEWFNQVDMDDFLSVFFINPDEGWATTWGCGYGSAYILHSTDSFSTWDTIRECTNDESSCGYYSIHFKDNDHGWVLRYEYIVSWWPSCNYSLSKTTDGGNTWQYVEMPSETEYHALCFTPEGKGCIVGDHGLVLSTNDWDDPWAQNSQGNTSVFYSIDFADPTNGWAVGSDAYDPVWGGWGSSIVHTSDGGSTWQEQSSNITGRLHSVISVDVNHVWAVGSSYSWDTNYILHTTDGGENWAVQKWDTGFHLMDIYFLDESNGWVVGGYSDGYGNSEGKIFNTINGGITWEEQDCDTCQFLNSVFFINTEIGWTVGRSIHYTQDGGQHWEEQQYDTSGLNLKSVYFTDTENGWIAGSDYSDGLLLHTKDGGTSWSYELFDDWLFSIDFLDNLYGVIAGSGGTILVTEDGGTSWEQQDTGMDSPLFSVCITPGGSSFAAGAWGTIIHSDIMTFFNEYPGTIPPFHFECYPNPFLETTAISFSLIQCSAITVNIYNLCGQVVYMHKDEAAPAGHYEIIFNGKDLPAGTYFCNIISNERMVTKKMIKL